MALSPALSKLPPTQDDLQHSRLICLLVAALEAAGLRPASRCGHVYIGQVLALGGRLPSVGVPERALLLGQLSQRLRQCDARSYRTGSLGSIGDGNRYAAPMPGRSSWMRSKAARTSGQMGTNVSRPVLSVSAGQQIAPYWSGEAQRLIGRLRSCGQPGTMLRGGGRLHSKADSARAARGAPNGAGTNQKGYVTHCWSALGGLSPQPIVLGLRLRRTQLRQVPFLEPPHLIPLCTHFKTNGLAAAV